MKVVKEEELVWYACYGSNIDLDRFLIYIKGGNLTVNGVVKPYRRCNEDDEAPRDSEPYIINHRLYFAKESSTWSDNGVGFISTKKNQRSNTYAKLYLISKIQFAHMFASENSRRTTHIDYNFLQNKKFQDFEYNFYNRIIQLEDNYNGYPILTFTNKVILQNNNPMDGYLQLISRGLKSVHQLNQNEITQYFIGTRIKIPKSKILEIVSVDNFSTFIVV